MISDCEKMGKSRDTVVISVKLKETSGQSQPGYVRTGNNRSDLFVFFSVDESVLKCF